MGEGLDRDVAGWIGGRIKVSTHQALLSAMFHAKHFPFNLIPILWQQVTLLPVLLATRVGPGP